MHTSMFFVLLQLVVCNAAISGFYYSPTPIGVDGGSADINSYDSYFTQIHTRDMGILRDMVTHIRISSLGTSPKNHKFLQIVHDHNISVIAGFGLNPYMANNSPRQLQLQLESLRSDFKKFIHNHKSQPAIRMWCIGDVEDYVFNIGTSLQQYPSFSLSQGFCFTYFLLWLFCFIIISIINSCDLKIREFKGDCNRAHKHHTY